MLRLEAMTPEFLQEVIDRSDSWTQVANELFKSSSMRPLVAARARKMGLRVVDLETNASSKIERKRTEGKRATDLKNFIEHTLPSLLTKNSPYDGKAARRYVARWNLHFGWLEYKCQECGNTGSHNGKKLTLQIDHINGDSYDHRLSNLRYLCPNCHTQTETFTGRNIAKNKARAACQD
jgi:5-methylcytosine-specific restriction endonuclease McrA